MRSVVLDGPDSWAQTMVTEGIIEKFVGLDFSDADTVFERCVTAINAMKKVRLAPVSHAETSRSSIFWSMACCECPLVGGAGDRSSGSWMACAPSARWRCRWCRASPRSSRCPATRRRLWMRRGTSTPPGRGWPRLACPRRATSWWSTPPRLRKRPSWSASRQVPPPVLHPAHAAL